MCGLHRVRADLRVYTRYILGIVRLHVGMSPSKLAAFEAFAGGHVLTICQRSSDIGRGLVIKRQAGNGRAALMTTQLEERDGAA